MAQRIATIATVVEQAYARCSIRANSSGSNLLLNGFNKQDDSTTVSPPTKRSRFVKRPTSSLREYAFMEHHLRSAYGCRPPRQPHTNRSRCDSLSNGRWSGTFQAGGCGRTNLVVSYGDQRSCWTPAITACNVSHRRPGER